MRFRNVLSSALVFVLAPLTTADFIHHGSAAHFFSTQNKSLVFAPEYGAPTAQLVAALPGAGDFNDITALFPVLGSGMPTQIGWGDWCVTARNVTPGGPNQTLYIEDCDEDDSKQLWTIDPVLGTVSNADGNCVTLGKAALNAPVTLSKCSVRNSKLQTWDPKPISSQA